MLLKDFLSRTLTVLLFGEWNHLDNFIRGHYGDNSCEIIFDLSQWFKRFRLKTFLI